MTNSQDAGATKKKPNKLVGIIVIVAILWGIGELTSPKGSTPTYTYADLARDKAAECVQQRGAGNWRASMGVTLEKFCDAAGALVAHGQMCSDHPEKC